MKQPEKLTLSQKILVERAGLLSDEWMCRFEDKNYMHIVKKTENLAEIKIIDKNKKESLGTDQSNQDNLIIT